MEVKRLAHTSIAVGNNKGLVVYHVADVAYETLVQDGVNGLFVVVTASRISLQLCVWGLGI